MRSASGSSVTRIELSLGGDQTTYQNINNLGNDPNNVFYQNLASIQKQLNLDAINLDDEGTTTIGGGDYYMDVCQQIASWCISNEIFVSITPYVNQGFWEQYVAAVNKSKSGTMDAVYLQCYGGADPGDWNKYLSPLTVVSGFDASTATPDEVQQELAGWSTIPMAGGFIFTGTSMVVGYGGNPPSHKPNGSPSQYAQAIVNGLKKAADAASGMS